MQEFDFKYAVNDTYMAVRYYGDEADVVIPDTWYGKPVSVLGEDLFKGHTEIRSIGIPASVTHIMGFAFDGCTPCRSWSCRRDCIPSCRMCLCAAACARLSCRPG